MLVVVANDLPPAVRGRMKIWFVEAKPGIFVSGLNDALANQVVDYLFDVCPRSGMIVFQSERVPPWYKIRTKGETKKNLIEMSGLQLLFENNSSDNKEK